MLVTRVTGDCPGCGGKACFGNVLVLDEELLRGCRRCRYQTGIPLPPVRKKVIYLDQFFFSHAFRGGDAQFLAVAERIKQLTQSQLLVSPYSSVHEDETHQWRGYKDKTHEQLMQFIKATSRGVRFDPEYRIEKSQILKAFQACQAQGPLEYRVQARDAIRGELDRWDSYFRIDVGCYRKDIELKRRLKADAVRGLVTLFDRWQESNDSFEQSVAIELRDAGRLYLEAYQTMARRLGQGDLMAVADSPIIATIVEDMRELIPRQVPRTEHLQRCTDFFASEYFAQVPHEWISAHMFATLKEQVKRGAYANREAAAERLAGIFDDIAHISTYAPYCDAFVMDAPMADLVRQPTVALEQRYGVRVFSRRTLDALLAWLDELEASVSAEHRAAVAAVYG
jgi:hypothetical protein